MKKGLLIIIGAMLVLAIVATGAVAAADDTKTQQVTYTIQDGYEWSAPGAVTLVLGVAVNEQLKVTKYNQPATNSLKFSVKTAKFDSTNSKAIVASSDGNTTLGFTLKQDTATIAFTAADTYVELKSGVKQTGDIPLSFTADSAVSGTGSGDLSDTLTYKAEIVS